MPKLSQLQLAKQVQVHNASMAPTGRGKTSQTLTKMLKLLKLQRITKKTMGDSASCWLCRSPASTNCGKCSVPACGAAHLTAHETPACKPVRSGVVTWLLFICTHCQVRGIKLSVFIPTHCQVRSGVVTWQLFIPTHCQVRSGQGY